MAFRAPTKPDDNDPSPPNPDNPTETSYLPVNATAQEDQTGDGTTSNVLFTGELLSQAERELSDR